MTNRSLPHSIAFAHTALCAVALAIAGLFAPVSASAQSSADGPFESAADLYEYWDAQYSSHGMHIVLEGQTVYSRFGFGPYLYVAYFNCPDGLIRQNCPPAGPFRNVEGIVGYWSQFAPSHAAAVYVDGQLVYSRYGFGPAVGAAYVSCPSRGALMTQCSP